MPAAPRIVPIRLTAVAKPISSTRERDVVVAAGGPTSSTRGAIVYAVAAVVGEVLFVVPLREVDHESENVDDADRSRQSGVRATARLRILVIEPQNFAREALERGARADAVEFLMTASPEEAEAVRAEQLIDVVVCAFPLPGAEALIRALRRERFPVLVMTSQIQRAIDAFGLRVPVLRQPVQLEQLLQQAVEHVGYLRSGGGSVFPALAALRQDGLVPDDRGVVEIPAPPNRRDPRRE
jgi:CheY-like chemotaxis protein